MTKSNTFSIHQFLKQRLSMNLTLRLGLIASVYFIYRFVLYFLDYTKLSVGLSAVFFIMCMCNFKEKLPRKMYSLLLTVIGIMLLYHDSYLPPPSSLTVDFTGNFISDLFYYAEILLTLSFPLFTFAKKGGKDDSETCLHEGPERLGHFLQD